MKTKWIIPLMLLFSVSLMAQKIDVPATSKLKKQEDYIKYAPKVVECVDWLNQWSMDAPNSKVEEVNSFVFAWLDGTHTFTMHSSDYLLAGLNPVRQAIIMYVAGCCKYAIEHNEKKFTQPLYKYGFTNMVQYYAANRDVLPEDQLMYHFIDAMQCGTLDQELDSVYTSYIAKVEEYEQKKKEENEAVFVPNLDVLKDKKNLGNYTQDALTCIKWALANPIGKYPKKTKEVNQFVFGWITETPTLKLSLQASTNLIFEKNSYLTMAFLFALTQYCIENNLISNDENAYVYAIETTLDYYLTNKAGMKDNAVLDNYETLRKEGALQQLLREQYQEENAKQ